MNISLKYFLILSLIFSLQACKKNQLGGKASFRGTVEHHGTAVPNAVIYIKYNATEFPGEDTQSYDTSVNADGFGNFDIDLYKGSYYLFAVGIDMNIPAPYKVRGGVSISIRNKEHLTRDIAVGEE